MKTTFAWSWLYIPIFLFAFQSCVLTKLFQFDSCHHCTYCVCLIKQFWFQKSNYFLLTLISLFQQMGTWLFDFQNQKGCNFLHSFKFILELHHLQCQRRAIPTSSCWHLVRKHRNESVIFLHFLKTRASTKTV